MHAFIGSDNDCLAFKMIKILRSGEKNIGYIEMERYYSKKEKKKYI